MLCAVVFLVGESRAELEKQVFTAKSEGIRIVVPRGWRATDQPSYPGLLLWMFRNQPDGQIVLTVERFTREMYCAAPIACRNLPNNSARFTCALREKLAALRIDVGPAQLGPKENDVAGLPSMYFDYDDGKRFVRQAVAATDDQVISLVLSTASQDARTNHVRAFDQSLRTLQRLPPAPGGGPGGGVGSGSGSDTNSGTDAGSGSGSSGSSPAVPTLPAVGPCPTKGS
jgi:hypothetical protein